jgi:hypothetical protein
MGLYLLNGYLSVVCALCLASSLYFQGPGFVGDWEILGKAYVEQARSKTTMVSRSNRTNSVEASVQVDASITLDAGGTRFTVENLKNQTIRKYLIRARSAFRTAQKLDRKFQIPQEINDIFAML